MSNEGSRILDPGGLAFFARAGRFPVQVIPFVLLSIAFGVSIAGPVRAQSVYAEGSSPGSPRTAEAASTCSVHPTKRIDLLVNLDPDTRLSTRRFWIPEPHFLFDPSSGIPLTIRDPNGRPRALSIHWARIAAHEWVVGIMPAQSQSTAPSTSGHRLFLPEPGGYGSVVFDDHGELTGASDIRIVLPAEVGSAGSGEPGGEAMAREPHPEQTLLLRLRSERGSTTQYFGDFAVNRLATDGIVCPAAPRLRGACSLSDALRGDGIGGEGASIFFEREGRLVSNVRERIQGYRIDPKTGERAEARTDARLPEQTMPPRATGQLRLVFDLALDAPIRAEAFDVFDPSGGSSAAIPIVVFDAVGRPVLLALHLSRTSAFEWRWTIAQDLGFSGSVFAYAGFDSVQPALSMASFPTVGPLPLTIPPDLPALVIGPDLNGLFSNGPTRYFEVLVGGEGSLRFDEAGVLVAVAQEGVWLAPGELVIARRLANRPDGADQPIALDFGIGASGLAAAFEVFAIDQDGYSAGQIASVRVSRNHVLEGVASNGVPYALSELAFADPGAPHCKLACSNRRDDDRDGLIDFPNDPGCASGFDGTE